MAPGKDTCALLSQLQQIRDAIQSYTPPPQERPIISTVTVISNEGKLRVKEPLPGLRILREEVNRECTILQTFLEGPQSSSPLSTNAPYLIAVWQELIHCRSAVALYRTFSLENGRRRRGHKSHKPSGRPIKVDVVAENGTRWIRINTIKNSRLMMEIHELDSYLTSSSEEDGSDCSAGDGPTTSTAEEFDNSVLRMARELLAAAEANPLPISGRTPRITMRLTRLDPTLLSDSGAEPDPRIARTVEHLHRMGVDVQLGGQPDCLENGQQIPRSIQPRLVPTCNINLDLSVLIALVSDITHGPLPHSPEDAPAMFRNWRTAIAKETEAGEVEVVANKTIGSHRGPSADESELADETEQTRALSRQTIEEMNGGLLQNIHERLWVLCKDSRESGSTSHTPDLTNVRFWTTEEARQRCLQIVAKIGGPRERQRAHALLAVHECPGLSKPGQGRTCESEKCDKAAAEKDYWEHSRYPSRFLPLVPIHVFPRSEITNFGISNTDHESIAPGSLSQHFSALVETCAELLADDATVQIRARHQVIGEELPRASIADVLSFDSCSHIPPAFVLTASKLTLHTVASMHAGASRGWTTLTANHASVRTLLKEMDKRGKGVQERDGMDEDPLSRIQAPIWLVDPRILAEGMRIDGT